MRPVPLVMCAQVEGHKMNLVYVNPVPNQELEQYVRCATATPALLP